MRAVGHQETDRPPIFADFTPETAAKLEKRFGLKEPELGIYLGNDMIVIPVGISTSFEQAQKGTYVCEWGIKWQKVGLYTEMIEHPLGDDRAFNSYKPPNPFRSSIYEEAGRIIKKYGDDYAIVGAIPCTIFEASWYLRGLDKFMVDLLTDKVFVNDLMDTVMHYHFVAGKRLIGMGVDIIWTGDDVGMQTGMLISPDLWREFLKPRYRYLFHEFKGMNPDIKIAYHSDGNIEPIIPELIEIGLDILNPIQPKCMDPVAIKERYGERLTLWGTLDEQEILPFWRPEGVREETKRLKKALGRGGGLILGPTHHVQDDTPIENLLAFYEEAVRG